MNTPRAPEPGAPGDAQRVERGHHRRDGWKTCLGIALLALHLSGPTGVVAQPTPEGGRPNLLPPREESVQEAGLVARFYYPAKGNPPWRPIVLLGGAQGGLVTAKGRIHPLVASGYGVLSVAYFKEKGLPDTLSSVPLEFFDRAKAWLTNHARVAPGGIAVIGSSKGGELALLLASRDPAIISVVGIVPASHVFEGIAPGFDRRSSWSCQGKDVPFISYVLNAAFFQAVASQQFRGVYQEALAEAGAAAEPARIPVEKINGALLLLSGKKDHIWPSTDMCNSMVQRLAEQRFPHPYKHVAYDTDHNVGSAPEHWVEITAFLRSHYPATKASAR